MLHSTTQVRSLLKAFSWRLVATITTVSIVYIMTGQLELTAIVGFYDIILKLILFFIHERVWNKIQFGRTLIDE
jgi:adenylylsulfate kinase